LFMTKTPTDAVTEMKRTTPQTASQMIAALNASIRANLDGQNPHTIPTRPTVTVLLDARGCVCGVYSDRATAEKKAADWNADPFIEPGTPDPDAPYATTTWSVK
jgi:hypothetical protein